MTTLKFALLGCGRVARKHIEAIDELEQGEIVAVCDILPDLAKRSGKQLGVPHFTDLDEMLEETPDIDIVNVLTPSGLHPEHVIQCTRHGKHVVVEKPMALRLEDADDMILECDRAGVRLFVVKQNRYNPPVQRLRAALEEGRLGKLVMGTVRVRWCRRQDYYELADWRGTWALDGGVLTNQASHHVDLLLWMMGPVHSVFAQTSTRLLDIEAEDTAAVVLKFASGALGIIEATTATRPKDLEGSLSVLGEKGSVIIGGFAVNEILTWNFESPTEADDTVANETRTTPDNVYGFGHTAFMRNVAECVRSGTAALVDGLEGRHSLELIHAIYESVETGREVKLRFRPERSPLGRKSR
jgi:predicted dehydrogenase